MTKIKILSEQLINQIAAGEVVERPASALKEMLENAIDAGATNLAVEIAGGGVELIRVTDNGCGMSRQDAILCLERHATSKIATLADLEKIATMGFRGEALAAIASVAKFKIQTRLANEPAGTEVLGEGGLIAAVNDCGCPKGTMVEVRDLFFNVPARRKFLKSTNTEVENLVDVTVNCALVFPQISFRMIVDGKVVLDLPATSDQLVRVRNLFGKNFSDNLVEVFNGALNLNLSGWIGKPEIARSSKSNQYLFVNNRPIKSAVLSYAVKQAFNSLIPKEKNPAFVLFLQIPADLVDVNVHPRKTEVKFKDEREVFRVLLQATEKALEKAILVPKWDGEQANYYLAAEQTERKLETSTTSTWSEQLPLLTANENSVTPRQHQEINTAELDLQQNTSSTQVVHSSESLATTPNWQQERVEVKPDNTLVLADFTILGQHANSFIVISLGEDILLLDQHAAHERIRYEELMRESEKQEKSIQTLLTPLTIELQPADVVILNGNKDFFDAMGMEIEHFGGNSFAIQTVPTLLANENLENLLLGLIDDCKSHGYRGDLFSRKEKILTYIACRTAVKFGDQLDVLEMESLVKKWLASPARFTCPHGRPAMIVLEKGELWKRFGRDYAGMHKNLSFKELGC